MDGGAGARCRRAHVRKHQFKLARQLSVAVERVVVLHAQRRVRDAKRGVCAWRRACEVLQQHNLPAHVAQPWADVAVVPVKQRRSSPLCGREQRRERGEERGGRRLVAGHPHARYERCAQIERAHARVELLLERHCLRASGWEGVVAVVADAVVAASAVATGVHTFLPGSPKGRADKVRKEESQRAPSACVCTATGALHRKALGPPGVTPSFPHLRFANVPHCRQRVARVTAESLPAPRHAVVRAWVWTEVWEVWDAWT
eukprot:360113-Chlamydomonas_euryale.AAC.1